MDNKSVTPEGLEPAGKTPAAMPPNPSPAGIAPTSSQSVPVSPLANVAQPTPSMLPGLKGLSGSSSPFGGTSSGGSSPLMFVLIVILGLGALVFAGMALTFYTQATSATKDLQSKETAAAAKAQSAQKNADAEAYRIAGESPFRSYIAPVEDGSFQIQFPKDWSAYVDEETGGMQVNLTVNPDFIRTTDGADELAAARVELIVRDSVSYMNNYSGNIKRGVLKQADITVSGQHGYDLTGQFQDKKTSRMVVIPVRDKVLVFINENSKYANEFNQILAQSKVIP